MPSSASTSSSPAKKPESKKPVSAPAPAPAPSSSSPTKKPVSSPAPAPSSSSRLFHPLLEDIPLPIRFVISGVTGNAIFLMVYNMALSALKEFYDAGIIFSVVQFGCIILNHFLNVGIVFGWPDNYLTSLLSNMPVGLTSLALGAWLAGTLERNQFDFQIKFGLGLLAEGEEDLAGGLLASIAVMSVTGVYNYIVLNLINNPKSGNEEDEKTKKEKKEL